MLDIYLIAIGGTGMAPLACLLQELGHRVRGSDGPLYPPMSTLLESAGIEALVGYDPKHLSPAPDLVVVGNAVPRTNPEAEAVEASQIERISMPQALYRFFLADRRPLVVAGSHGKTTTTAIASWVYSATGQEPGFLVGGVPQNFDDSFARGSGERFIVEGDEYNAAYFDRGPKFFHYRPDTLILTSVEYDHADLYPTHDDLKATYLKLVELVPEDGLLIAFGDSPDVRQTAEGANCRVIYYGLDGANDICPEPGWTTGPEGTRFRVASPEGPVDIALPLAGEHNLMNALAVYASAIADGIPASEVARALGSFKGVKRRQEVLGEAGGVTVVDDFAHHPTAVRLTLEALANRYPDRRLVVALEPRSLTAARRLFFDEYLDALSRADQVLLAPVFHAERFSPDERLDTEELAAKLSRAGTPARALASNQEVFEEARGELEKGDVFVTMSSGSFDGLPHKVAAHFAALSASGR